MFLPSWRPSARFILGTLAVFALLATASFFLWQNIHPQPLPQVHLTSEERDYLVSHPLIRLAPDPNFPPIEWIDAQGNYQGLVADYFDIIQKRLGIPIEIVHLKTWDEVIQQARTMRIDGITAAQDTPERRTYLNYTPPILDIPNVIISRKETQENLSFEKMGGMSLAITKGNALHEYVRTKYPSIRIVPVDDDLSCLVDVSFGRVDATVVNLAIASWHIEKHGISNLRITGDSGKKNPLSIAVRKDRPILKSILSKGLAAITPEERETIQRRWISLSGGNDNLGRTVLLVAGITAVTALVVMVIILTWNRILRRQVAQATAKLQEELAERRRTEEALLRSEGRLRAATQASPDLLFLVDRDGHLGEVYTSREDLLYQPLSSIQGKTIQEILPEAVSKPLLGAIASTIDTGEGVVLEYCLELPDATHWFEGRSALLKPLEGETPTVLWIARDITERRQAEQARQEEKERLAITLRSIADGFLATDEKGRIVLFNEAASALTGWSVEEAIGKLAKEVFPPLLEREHKPIPCLVESTIRTGKICTGPAHLLLTSRTGGDRLITATASPIIDQAGKTIGAILVFRDITTVELAERDLHRIQKLESLGVLAGGIAHDFNNLLAAILGNLTLARLEIQPSSKATPLLSEAEQACERARSLTQQLLTFSHGGVPIKRPLQLEPLIRQAVSFALSGTASAIRFEIEEHIYSINADEGQIAQVFHNIALNASQAMPGGGTVEIQARNLTLGESEIPNLPAGRYVRIDISDTGAGIPEELLPRIFDPFFTTKPDGHGLGLASAHSVIDKHGGRIEVKSRIGHGTTISLFLPATDLAPESSASLPLPTSPRECRILIMDDETSILDMAERMLKRLGYRSGRATNGEEAIRLYQQALKEGNPFDAVIMDLTVHGGMGGRETMEELARIDSNVIAIVSSGYSNDPIMADPERFGFRAVVAKPYRLDQLAQVLSSVLAPSSQEG